MHRVDDVVEIAQIAGAIVRHVDVVMLFHGEEDVQGVERVDPRLGERHLQVDPVRQRFLFPNDSENLLFELGSIHGEVIIRAVKLSEIQRRFWIAYPVLILVCALLFVVLRDAPDPSRRIDRVDKDDAAVIALAELRRSGGARYEAYEVVHVALAKRGEVTNEPLWLVLCDRRERSALREAVVVQLRAADGEVVGIRAIDADNGMFGRSLPLRQPAAAAGGR